MFDIKRMQDFAEALAEHDWFMPVKKGGMSKAFYAVPFQGCELIIDPDNKTLTIHGRGYTVDLEWGNTDTWRAEFVEDDIDGAMRIRVTDEECMGVLLDDEKPVVDWITLPDKGVADEDYKVVDEANPHTGIWKAGSFA